MKEVPRLEHITRNSLISHRNTAKKTRTKIPSVPRATHRFTFDYDRFRCMSSDLYCIISIYGCVIVERRREKEREGGEDRDHSSRFNGRDASHLAEPFIFQFYCIQLIVKLHDDHSSFKLFLTTNDRSYPVQHFTPHPITVYSHFGTSFVSSVSHPVLFIPFTEELSSFHIARPGDVISAVTNIPFALASLTSFNNIGFHILFSSETAYKKLNSQIVKSYETPVVRKKNLRRLSF